MWKKVTKGEGRGGVTGVEPRKTFAIQRGRTQACGALLIPYWAHNDEARCTIYEDGTRLAFALGERGDYRVSPTGPKARSRKVIIPGKLSKALPYGTHDIPHTMDGDMIVIDLAPFMARTGGHRMAAE